MGRDASADIGYGYLFEEGEAPWENMKNLIKKEEDCYGEELFALWLTKIFNVSEEEVNKLPYDIIFSGTEGYTRMGVTFVETSYSFWWSGTFNPSLLVAKEMDALKAMSKLAIAANIKDPPRWFVTCSYI
tara:strand:- start:2615 stop:3004 length:390 start_codon:yes stop_codon:yes gene_type:complete